MASKSVIELCYSPLTVATILKSNDDNLEKLDLNK